jgi:hypothetical protein
MHAQSNWRGRAGWCVGLVFGLVSEGWIVAATQSHCIVCLRIQPSSREGEERGNAL